MLRKIDPNRSGYMGVDQRVAPRTDCYARLPITTSDYRQHMTTMVNISADGALLRFDSKLHDGDHISIKFPIIGVTKAYVAWSVGGQTGVQFDESIAPHDYLPLLKAFGVKPAEQ